MVLAFILVAPASSDAQSIGGFFKTLAKYSVKYGPIGLYAVPGGQPFAPMAQVGGAIAFNAMNDGPSQQTGNYVPAPPPPIIQGDVPSRGDIESAAGGWSGVVERYTLPAGDVRMQSVTIFSQPKYNGSETMLSGLQRGTARTLGLDGILVYNEWCHSPYAPVVALEPEAVIVHMNGTPFYLADCACLDGEGERSQWFNRIALVDPVPPPPAPAITQSQQAPTINFPAFPQIPQPFTLNVQGLPQPIQQAPMPTEYTVNNVHRYVDETEETFADKFNKIGGGIGKGAAGVGAFIFGAKFPGALERGLTNAPETLFSIENSMNNGFDPVFDPSVTSNPSVTGFFAPQNHVSASGGTGFGGDATAFGGVGIGGNAAAEASASASGGSLGPVNATGGAGGDVTVNVPPVVDVHPHVPPPPTTPPPPPPPIDEEPWDEHPWDEFPYQP
jgi:hypothetical protein